MLAIDLSLSDYIYMPALDRSLSDYRYQQRTATTAKTLWVSPISAEKDTIMMAEYHTFIVRSVAEIVNMAHEHGVATESVDDAAREVSFQWKNPDFLFKNPDFLLKNGPDFLIKQVVSNSIVSEEDFAHARFVSRVRAMFKRVDRDDSGNISAREVSFQWKNPDFLSSGS